MTTYMETDRLLLRRMAESDVDDFLAYQTHPAVLRYQPYEPADRGKALRFLSDQAAVTESDSGFYLALAVYHTADRKVIGEVSIDVLPREQSRGGIGWSFHPDYHGRGYAYEAASALMEYGFCGLHLHRQTTFCDVRNVASYRLMERLGMRREGHHLRSMLLRGEWQDTYSYALLREEWISRSIGNLR